MLKYSFFPYRRMKADTKDDARRYQESQPKTLMQESTLLACIFFLTFTVQLFNNILQSVSLFLIPLILFTFAFIFVRGKLVISSKRIFYQVWYLMLAGFLISYLRTKLMISNYADLIILICGIGIIFSIGDNPSVYLKSLKIMKWVPLFYAASIWIQAFFPSVYMKYLSLIPEKSMNRILEYYNSSGMCTGFSTNSLFTAAHITVGILLAILFMNKAKLSTYFYLAFLSLSFLMTGKRSTTVILVFIGLCMFVLSAQRKALGKRLIIVLAIAVILVISYFALRNVLIHIPAFSRIVQTIDGLMLGQDVSSNRSVYYAYAVDIFKEHPLFGIGWGNYRASTIGVVTTKNEVEVHNIYLQLLAETGIIGFLCITSVFFVVLATTYRYYKQIQELSDINPLWKKLMLFSFIYQLFFLLQGIAENTLYEPNFWLTYLFCCSIPAAWGSYLWKASAPPSNIDKKHSQRFKAKEIQDRYKKWKKAKKRQA